jgi:hypothetical protein
MAGMGNETDAMPIRGMDDNSVVRFGPGGAVPGDRIVGILEPGAGITIYPIQSPGLTKFDDQPNRWIDIRWDIDENNKNRFPLQDTGDGDQCARHSCGRCSGHCCPANPISRTCPWCGWLRILPKCWSICRSGISSISTN